MAEESGRDGIDWLVLLGRGRQAGNAAQKRGMRGWYLQVRKGSFQPCSGQGTPPPVHNNTILFLLFLPQVVFTYISLSFMFYSPLSGITFFCLRDCITRFDCFNQVIGYNIISILLVCFHRSLVQPFTSGEVTHCLIDPMHQRISASRSSQLF